MDFYSMGRIEELVALQCDGAQKIGADLRPIYGDWF